MSFHPLQELDACACSQVSKISHILNFTQTTIKTKTNDQLLSQCYNNTIFSASSCHQVRTEHIYDSNTDIASTRNRQEHLKHIHTNVYNTVKAFIFLTSSGLSIM